MYPKDNPIPEAKGEGESYGILASPSQQCRRLSDCKASNVDNEDILGKLEDLLRESDGRKSRELLDELKNELGKRSIDEEAFAKAVAFAKANARNPLAFARKCILEDIRKGKYDKAVREPLSSRNLFREMERGGFSDDADGYGYTRVDLWLTWYWENTDIGIDEIRAVTKGALEYCERKNIRNASAFLACLRKSKTLALHCDERERIESWVQGRVSEFKESDEEWETTMASL